MDQFDDFEDDIDPAIISDLISGHQRYVAPVNPPPATRPHPVSQRPHSVAATAPARVDTALKRFPSCDPALKQCELSENKSAAIIRTERLSGVDPEAANKTGVDEHRFAPRLMTVRQVADYLGMSISTVWRLEKAKAGFPNPLRIAGSTRWDRCAIDRFLDRGHAPGTRRR